MIMAKNIPTLSRSLGLILLLTLIPACASDLQTKVSGHLNGLSKHQTVAILPVEASNVGHKEMANMFRQGLYANLKQSKFNLLEKYIIDGLLKQNHLNDPGSFLNINPMQFGEILGADAIVFSRINKVERSYLIVHSSIELSVSVQMVDTRTGEILWRAEQTEHDFSGIGKIPTGITTALLAPIQFVTNKFNLSKMTSKMVDKLTALVKKPENAQKETQFENTVISKNATTDLKKIEEVQQLKAEWDEKLVMGKGTQISSSQKSQNETQNKKKNLSPPLLIGKIQSEVPLKANVRKVVTVETEMSPHLNTPKTNNVEAIIPIPLSTYNATLAIQPPIDAQKSEEKIKLSESTNNSLKLTFFTVQVGAYKKKTYAQTLLNKLLKKGYKAFLVREGTYKVQVDKFKNLQDAQQLARHILEKEKIKNFVTHAG
jgi:cell division septation protein DedD